MKREEVFHVKPTSYTAPTVDAKRIPQERIEAMARPVLAAAREAFKDPEIAREFTQWLAKRRATKGATS